MSKVIKLKSVNLRQTQKIGEEIAVIIKVGDVIALEGEPGAGKTALVRAIIRSITNNARLEVPSPTYTIVQQYDTKRFPIAHVDLYRIKHKAEMREIGIDEAKEEGVVIVEWPELLGVTPSVNIKITQGEGDKRMFEVSGAKNNDEGVRRIQRSMEIRKFLENAGIKNAKRQQLAGDASARRYETISVSGRDKYVLMDAQNKDVRGKQYRKKALLAENMNAFIGIQKILKAKKFGAPEINKVDYKKKLILMQNLGSAKIVGEGGEPKKSCYVAAVDVLAKMHQQKWAEKVDTGFGAHKIPHYTKEVMLVEVGLMVEWYAKHKNPNGVSEKARREFVRIWKNLLAELFEEAEVSLVLRDYHSPNIIMMPPKIRKDRVGIIDFQDAVFGSTAYDVASIVQDARVDVPPKMQGELVRRYCKKRKAGRKSFDETRFLKDLAIIQAQRAVRILGTFVRLSQRDQKHEYLNHLRRLETYLRQTCKQDEILKPLKKWLKEEVGI